MTREEAILLSAYTGALLVPDFSDVHKFCEDTLGRPIWTHEFADQDVQKEIREKLRPQIMELIQNISALRSVSREKVEETKAVFFQPGVEDVAQASYRCSHCYVQEFGDTRGINFCPHCGAPMTDEAVEILAKRMEEIRNV